MDQESDREMEFLDSVVVKEEYIVQEEEEAGFPDGQGGDSFGFKDPDGSIEVVEIKVEEVEDESPSPAKHQCQTCASCFSTPDELRKHLVIEHVKEDTYECFYCFKECETETELTEHQKSHALFVPVKCKVCKEIFPNSSDLIQHLKMDREKRTKTEKKLDCKICKDKTKDKTHIASNTTKNVPIPINDCRHFECKYCDEKFSKADELIDHSKTHTEGFVKAHKCKICQKDFDSLQELRKHIATHSPKRRYSWQCTICGMVYFSVQDLRNHLHRWHKM